MLSMFAGFGFDWPPAIKGIFNVFSLVNFNFELLAPECSVSLNFEAKWWARLSSHHDHGPLCPSRYIIMNFKLCVPLRARNVHVVAPMVSKILLEVARLAR